MSWPPAWANGAYSSSARRPNLHLHPWVEAGSTPAPLNRARARFTVCGVKFRDLTPPSTDGPPQLLRIVGWIAMATVLVSAFTTDPKPGWSGDGVLVIVGIAGMATGLVLSARRHEWWPGA